MPSTAARGTVSRIVNQLGPGISPTIGRYLVDQVVTELGVARLRGLSIAERREALAAVCHPDFRGPLLR